jgi:hypothetical protein
VFACWAKVNEAKPITHPRRDQTAKALNLETMVNPNFSDPFVAFE